MEKSSISVALNHLMDERKLTVTELANGTGIGKATISKLKSKDTNQIDLDILQKLANFFNVRLDYFCGYEDYSESIVLSENEKKAFELMKKLNERGMEQLLQQTEILTEVDRFRKKK